MEIDVYSVVNARRHSAGLDDIDDEYPSGWVSDIDLIDATGVEIVEIVAWEDFGDYQGDTIYLLKEGDRYGVLVFGYGSCSGCDALEACASWDEVNQLAADTYQLIRWADSREAIGALVTDATVRNDWFIYDDDAKAFLDKIAAWSKGMEVLNA